MRVTFYGVRGSIATPGLSTVRYGGNTVCVDVRLSDGTVVVLDAGTGIRELGRVLLREGHKTPIHSLITHAHWDHIIGIPFFGPIWRKDHAHHSLSAGDDRAGAPPPQLDPVRSRSISPRRPPTSPPRSSSSIRTEERWRIGSAVVSRIQLNHPGGAQGFRIDDADGASMCYLTDNELAPPGPPTTSREAARQVRAQRRACSFTTRSTSKPTCRRSTAGDIRWSARCSSLRAQSEASAVALFHHEPERDDEALDRIGVSASVWLKEQGSSTQAVVAREGLTLTVRAALASSVT